jgi:predicted dehydrogenase
MLRDPNVDAVAMFTPAPQHVDDCVDVLNAGKHVVCAVPAAYSLEQCQRLVDTVKKTGLTYMQAETSCYHAATITAYALARESRFGTIYYTQGEYLHNEGGFRSAKCRQRFGSMPRVSVPGATVTLRRNIPPTLPDP